MGIRKPREGSRYRKQGVCAAAVAVFEKTAAPQDAIFTNPSESIFGSAVDGEPGLLVVVEAQASTKLVGTAARLGDVLYRADPLGNCRGIIAVQLVPGQGIVGRAADVARHAAQPAGSSIEGAREFGGKGQKLGAVAQTEASRLLGEVGITSEIESAKHRAQVDLPSRGV